MEFLELTFTITIIAIIVMLLITDLFFNADVPTHTAYVLTAIVIAKAFNTPLLSQLGTGILAWCCLIAFHYFVWIKASRVVRNKIRSMTYHHKETSVKYGKIKSIDGELFISVNGDLYKFESLDGKQKIPGEKYQIRKEEAGCLFI
jgi:hypothetical protein